MLKNSMKIVCVVIAMAGIIACTTGCSSRPSDVSSTAEQQLNATPAQRAQQTQQAVQRIQATQNIPPQVRASLIAAQNHQQHP